MKKFRSKYGCQPQLSLQGKEGNRIRGWKSHFTFALIVPIFLLSVACQPTDKSAHTELFTEADTPASEPTSTHLPVTIPRLSDRLPLSGEQSDVSLGMQLFFDPILSADRETSCASCHPPELGFSNGEAVTEGRSSRNVQGLWNVGYRQFLLWDGSETSLEAQALLPLTHAAEMGADLDKVVVDLRGIPAYVERFEVAFEGEDDVISAETITIALAAFQRSLISNNSPVDQFAAGNAQALTPSERRGLDLFFSEETGCADCHRPPLFAQDTFRVIGVPSDDLGRAGVEPDGVVGAFRVPTLRNVALTPPYMHNGSLATLEDVIDFYADGGGRAHAVTNVDPTVKPFDLTEQDRADLVAFLHALTDVHVLDDMDIPVVALSGLPTVLGE